MMFVIGLLLLPTVIGVAQIPRWIDARSTAELAAQEAARAMALAPDAGAGQAAAEAVALQVVVNHGWPTDTLRGVAFSGELAPGGEVRATVTIAVPAIVVPPVGAVGGGVDYSWTHTERIDDYRGEP